MSHFEQVLHDILVDAEPVVGEPLSLELPELAENGNVVPYSLAVDSPMTDTDYVRRSTCCRRRTRRLWSPSSIWSCDGQSDSIGTHAACENTRRGRPCRAVDGGLLVAVRKVDVTIGGCGNE